jgi:hypothetical protein
MKIFLDFPEIRKSITSVLDHNSVKTISQVILNSFMNGVLWAYEMSWNQWRPFHQRKINLKTDFSRRTAWKKY